MANGIRRVEPVWLPTRVKNFAQRARLLDCPGAKRRPGLTPPLSTSRIRSLRT